jgi:hypothetical protein
MDREVRPDASGLYEADATAIHGGCPAFIDTRRAHKSAPEAGTPIQLPGYTAQIWQHQIAETGAGMPRTG